VSARFDAYGRRKEELAPRADPAGFRTAGEVHAPAGALALGNAWTRALFDGPFHVSASPDPALPAVSLVFVQSRDGNTVTADPSTLGGGETDLHVVYEGLSRVAADAVLAGANTARGEELVFSVWHPEIVPLRLELGKPRHPAQVVVTHRGDLPFDVGLMFTTPELRVWLVAPTGTARRLRDRLCTRRWIEVIDAGDPPRLTAALHQLRERGVGVISAVGGRRVATVLIDEGAVQDLYLTTSPADGGEPGTPFYSGPPLPMTLVVEKHGIGAEAGIRFQHFRLQPEPPIASG
jgi:riboflavin biosynthesis pyrimidine reductase